MDHAYHFNGTLSGPISSQFGATHTCHNATMLMGGHGPHHHKLPFHPLCMPPHEFEQLLNGTIGATLVGGIVAAILLGVSTVQAFFYYRLKHPDGIAFRLMIFMLWLFDLLHMAFIAHALYFYLIVNFMNPIAITKLVWSLFAQLILTALTSLIVRFIFIRRIWNVSDRNLWCTVPLTALSIVTFVGEMAFTVLGLHAPHWFNLDLKTVKWLLFTTFTIAVAVDVSSACVMGVLLAKRHTGFTKTDDIINKYISFCVNAGVLTSLSSISVLVAFAVAPRRMIFVAFFFVLNPIFLNALLVSLNWRDMRIEQPVHNPDPVIRGFVRRKSSRLLYGRDSKRTKSPDPEEPLAIKVETRTVQVADDEHEGNQWNATYLSYIEARNATEHIRPAESPTGVRIPLSKASSDSGSV